MKITPIENCITFGSIASFKSKLWLGIKSQINAKSDIGLLIAVIPAKIKRVETDFIPANAKIIFLCWVFYLKNYQII